MKEVRKIMLGIAMLLLTVTLGVSQIASATTIGVIGSKPDNVELVTEFWESINEDDWDSWISFYPSDIQSEYRKFITEDNIRENVGILTVEYVAVEKVEKIDNKFAPKMYYELQKYFSDEAKYECYSVDLILEVTEENDYFQNGSCSYLTIVVNDNESWKIGTICKDIIGSDSGLAAPNAITSGIGYGLITTTPKPQTISVMDETGTIHPTVSFNEFITNVTCNEIGNLGFDSDAINAQIISVKMCGWWAKAGGYRAAYGCDIKYGDVAFRSSYQNIPIATIRSINSAVMSLDSWRMLSSTASGQKLFFASYYAGGYNANGAGEGRLRQNGANYLATAFGYTWKEILHYYYDNSAYNNPNVGTVVIST